MELVAAATLYGLFSVWLLFPLFGVPRIFMASTAVLVWLDFLAVLTWGYTREDCARGSCSPLAEAARSAVAVDLPALAILLVVLAVAHAVRQRHGGPRSAWRRGTAPVPEVQRPFGTTLDRMDARSTAEEGADCAGAQSAADRPDHPEGRAQHEPLDDR